VLTECLFYLESLISDSHFSCVSGARWKIARAKWILQVIAMFLYSPLLVQYFYHLGTWLKCPSLVAYSRDLVNSWLQNETLLEDKSQKVVPRLPISATHLSRSHDLGVGSWCLINERLGRKYSCISVLQNAQLHSSMLFPRKERQSDQLLPSTPRRTKTQCKTRHLPPSTLIQIRVSNCNKSKNDHHH
jgi:hypothetical protein